MTRSKSRTVVGLRRDDENLERDDFRLKQTRHCEPFDAACGVALARLRAAIHWLDARHNGLLPPDRIP